MDTKRNQITDAEYLRAFREGAEILKGNTPPSDDDFIAVVGTKGFIVAFVFDDEEFMCNMVARVFEDACRTFLSSPPIGKFDPKCCCVMMRATDELKINNLLADRVSNKLRHIFELNEKQTEKYIGRLKKGLETGSSKMCVMCCKKGIKKCPCGKERYCSSECQKKDWKLHKHIHN